MTPDVGVIVQRIRYGDFVAQHRTQAGVGCSRNRWHIQAARLRQIGHQGGFATRAAGRNNARATQGPVHMQELAGLDQTRRVAHPGHTTAGKQGVVQGIGPGQGTGVAHGRLGAQGRRSGLERHKRHALAQRFERHARKGGHIVQTFDVHADHTHARVGQERVNQAFHAVACLVAHGNQIGHRQCAPLHGQVQADVAALGDERHAALYPLAPVLVGPQSHTVQIIQHAVAIGPEQGHGARLLHELLLQRMALGPHLGKA